MRLALSEPLSTVVAKRFAAAKEGGHLIFSPTQVTTIQTSGISYQLRYCPSLAKKPSALPKPADSAQTEAQRQGKKPDPFDNPSPELLVAQTPGSDNGDQGYWVVLNKFPIIRNHFILATREWKSQTDLLEKRDLEACYACIKAWKKDDNGDNGERNEGRLFAFFNSGPESGASQPHRHIQFLPVEDMRQTYEGVGVEGWSPLIDVVAERCRSQSQSKEGYLTDDRLPFAHFALPIPTNPSAETLHSIYISLYKVAVSAVIEGSENPADLSIRDHGPAAISHNLAMTETEMMICPRRSENVTIPIQRKEEAKGEGVVEPGVIALNGTVLGGTLMVKMEEEWEELKRSPDVLAGVLGKAGFPVGGRVSL
ncbi:putative bis(5'-nucleosyl)-tetraphosphatase [Aspergillus chevalieri]|uniref:Bifunctional AP-4-A phosphorylase/ADP sulfurylase n=1 Tax=Aspergillus chevalieri TaxID=182096 RepID=A0A7R7VV28_ASPCH|nr:bifunctional AP-4-A phosphorylase/ADP sulfurylase [Aspergillus chevalieri]BCR90728.1 bifunctional AP-4-A phosphorylase/ADP sulfurylase [Aspergillus chevalieri]